VAVIVGAIASSAEQVWRWPGRTAGSRLRSNLEDTARHGLVGWVDVVADWVFAGRRGIDLAGRVRGNLMIALGVVVAALGGALSFLGDTTGHAVGLGFGVMIMFGGFLGAVAPTASAAVADARAGRPRPAAGVDPEAVTGSPVAVTVYTRRGCTLCETAEQLAAAEASRVVTVDIDADPHLQREYNLRVPVVVIAGRVVAEGVVRPGEIADALASTSRTGS
jgi:glutaredoxin